MDDLPDEIWAKDCPAMDAASDELDDTAAALCFYRPSTLEGLHLKAEFMVATQFFVDVENRDFFTQADQRLPAAWQGCRAVDRQVGMRTAMLHFMSHGFAECGRKPFEINGNGLQHDAT